MRALVLPPLAAVLCAATAAATARPAAAQTHAAADAPRPAVATLAVARPVAEYRIETVQYGFPEHVTVADSAGRLVASYRTRGTDVARPLSVRVRGRDFVLRAHTPSGPLTIVLEGQNGDVAPGLVGRWRMGEHEGRLHGTVQR